MSLPETVQLRLLVSSSKNSRRTIGTIPQTVAGVLRATVWGVSCNTPGIKINPLLIYPVSLPGFALTAHKHGHEGRRLL